MNRAFRRRSENYATNPALLPPLSSRALSRREPHVHPCGASILPSSAQTSTTRIPARANEYCLYLQRHDAYMYVGPSCTVPPARNMFRAAAVTLTIAPRAHLSCGYYGRCLYTGIPIAKQGHGTIDIAEASDLYARM